MSNVGRFQQLDALVIDYLKFKTGYTGSLESRPGGGTIRHIDLPQDAHLRSLEETATAIKLPVGLNFNRVPNVTLSNHLIVMQRAAGRIFADPDFVSSTYYPKYEELHHEVTDVLAKREAGKAAGDPTVRKLAGDIVEHGGKVRVARRTAGEAGVASAVEALVRHRMSQPGDMGEGSAR